MGLNPRFHLLIAFEASRHVAHCRARGPVAGHVAGLILTVAGLIERLPSQPYLVQTAYGDPDLGPLLRSEPLRAFRARYPEPPPAAPRFDPEDDD